MEIEELIAKADELSNIGDDSAALSIGNDLVTTYPEDARAWSLRSHLLASAGRLEEAIGDVSKAISLNSTEPCLFFDRGRYALEAAADRSAVADFTRALALCDSHKNDYYRETLHFMRAEAHVRLGDKAQALADLEKVQFDEPVWTYRLRTKAELMEEVNQLPG